MSGGIVQACNHCHGTSVCKQGFGNARSCADCLREAGLDDDDIAFDPIMCFPCHGTGSVWIGPHSHDAGEVVKCVHCAGEGHCEQGFGHSRSCRACLIIAGKDAGDIGFTPVACGACNGQGSVWVGPQEPDHDRVPRHHPR